jgi:hypothetical protein
MPTELKDVPDLLSPAGATALADHINAYWAERGRNAGAERYEMPGGGGYGVRSRMVNGIAPPTKDAHAMLTVVGRRS